MKKALFVIFLVFLSSFALSGVKHDLDLNNGTATVTVNERDIIEFMYLIRDYEEPEIIEGKEVTKFFFNKTKQRIMIDKVKPGYVDITNFIEGSDVPFYVKLNKAIVLNLDFERDGITDMKIKLLNIDNKTVTLKFEDVVGGGKLDIEDIKGEIVEEKDKEEIKPEEEDIKEEPIKTITEKEEVPWYIQRLVDNWELTSIVALVVLILVWNKRGIRRFIRRTF